MARAVVGDRAEDLILKDLLAATPTEKLTDTSGSDAMNAMYIASGMKPLPNPTDEPEVSCDQCGAADAKQRCSACASAHYCTKQCQVAAWKSGHKAACGGLQAACKRDGKAVVAALKDVELGADRVTDLGLLDREGAYKVAVSNGLFPGLTAALCDEAEQVEMLWLNPQPPNVPTSLFHHISTSVFRGERHRTDGGFGKADGGRLASFLRAEPAGWLAMLAAGNAVARMAVGAEIEQELWAYAHRAARDVWSFFNLALIHRAVAVAIFRVPKPDAAEPDSAEDSAPLDTSASSFDAVLAHGLRLGVLTAAEADKLTDSIAEGLNIEASAAMELAPLVADAAGAAADTAAARSASAAIAMGTVQLFMRCIGTTFDPKVLDERRDQGGTIEGNIFQAAAMLSYWAQELHVVSSADFDACLGMSGTKRAMYRNFSTPMAVATIRKGSKLSMEELSSVLRPMQGGGGKGAGGGGGGKAKGQRGKR